MATKDSLDQVSTRSSLTLLRITSTLLDTLV